MMAWKEKREKEVERKNKDEGFKKAQMEIFKQKEQKQKDVVELERKAYEELISKAEEAASFKDKYLRALADYENLRKRFEREKSEFVRLSNQFLISELFPIMDSFDVAINSIEKSNDKESFLKGLKMLQQQFHRILESNGLQKIKSVGERFDPKLHEATEEINSDKFPPGAVVEEIRSGYVLGGRVLRPALVKVSKGEEEIKGDKNGKGDRY